MPYCEDVLLGPRERSGLQRVHADIDVAVLLSILEMHPVLKSSSHDSFGGADPLNRFAAPGIPYQHGDTVRGFKVGADVVRGLEVGDPIRVLHDLLSRPVKMVQQSN